MTATLLNPERVAAATTRLDGLVQRAGALREKYGDAPLFVEVILVHVVADDMDLHRVHLAELIALAAVRLAERDQQIDYLQGQLGGAVDGLLSTGLERVASEMDAEADARRLVDPRCPDCSCRPPDAIGGGAVRD